MGASLGQKLLQGQRTPLVPMTSNQLSVLHGASLEKCPGIDSPECFQRLQCHFIPYPDKARIEMPVDLAIFAGL